MTTSPSRACLGPAQRTIYLVLATALTAFSFVEMVRFGGATWAALSFLVLPDVALLYGAVSGLEQGRLHPRAVRFYNVAHRFWGPLTLMAVGLWLPPLVFTSGAMWAAHIALDRCLGFGLRSREGYQRIPVCR